MGEALRIFELAQLVGNADQHVGVRPHAEPAAVLDERGRGKGAVAEVGLGDRAKARDRAAAGKGDRFGFGHVGGVDQAPALADIGILQQPLDGALA